MSQRGLIREVEVVDRAPTKGKCARRVSRPTETRLLPTGDFFGDQQRQEIAVAPTFPLGALHEIAPDRRALADAAV